MKNLYACRLSILILCFCWAYSVDAQDKFPVKEWEICKPEKYGYDSAKLEIAHKYIVDSMNTTGLVVVVSGEIIFKYGNIEQVSYLASCRKSLLAMLYGKYVENGTVDLNKTVGELGLMTWEVFYL